ncbi:MAG TPA: MFS transporter, partial [Pirellulales bacterium]|nr:MFS transporter [Pirellulales bacterium]
MKTSSRPQRARARRAAFRLGYCSGALWSIGNGLTSGSLITYLAIDLGAKGVGVSLVLAIQATVGTLRVFAPPLIDWFGGARRACLTLTLASYAVIVALPVATLGNSPLRQLDPVPTLITILCVHQLLEHLGAVALWTWWADLVPRRIRGRFFARRNMWQLAVLVPAVWASGKFVDYWKLHHADAAMVGYGIVTAAGACFLLGSLIPLFKLPERLGPFGRTMASTRPISAPWAGASAVASTFRTPAFRRVLAFGAWFSIANGLTQAAQNIYPKTVLEITLAQQAMLVVAMRLGQVGYSACVGPFSDRYGNRPALIISQALQAAGILFFCAATPAHPQWFYGAWILWSAFAGLNICIPSLLLKIAPCGQTSAYVGAYFGITGLLYAAATVVGGYLHDELLHRF